MTKPQREAQRMAYQALQEALDRRDNGGRSRVPVEPRTGADDAQVRRDPSRIRRSSR